MKNNKRRKRLIILCLALLIMCIPIKYNYKDGGTVSYNPLSISKGFIQVFILDKDYYEIQEYPKIMIANKDMNLLDYMKNLGWKYVETTDENKLVMENIYEFKCEDFMAYVEVIDHKNYYIWKWRE